MFKLTLKRSVLIVFMASFSLTAHAGKDRGGGNARVCFSSVQAAQAAKRNPLNRDAYWDAIESVELIDLYEARRPRGENGIVPSIVESNPGENGRAFAERIARRFDHRLALFANLIREGMETFSQNQIVWSEEPLGRTNDISPAIPIESKMCTTLALAIQKDVNGSDKIYLDRRLFQHPKHSLLSRNVTFLHEYIYQYARDKRGQENSSASREAVGLAISTLPKGTDVNQADSMGLSIAKILESLHVSDLIDFYEFGSFHHNFPLYVEIWWDVLQPDSELKEFQRALATLPAAIRFRDMISDLVIDRGHYLPSGVSRAFDPEYGSCTRGSNTQSSNSVLSSCLVVTSNASEFVKDPVLIKELQVIDANLKAYLSTEAKQVMQSSVLPEILQKSAERLTKSFSVEAAEKYKSILASWLMDSIWIPENDFTSETDQSWKFMESEASALQSLIAEDLKMPAESEK